MDAPTITLGGHTATLIEPSPLAALALARDEKQAETDDPAVTVSLMAAALAITWPQSVTWPSRPRPRPWRAGVPVVVYGAEVYDAIRAATKSTVPFRDLMAAMRQAYTWALSHLLTESEVQAAEDFSEAPEGA